MATTRSQRPFADLPAPQPEKHKHGPGWPRRYTVPLEQRLWDNVDKTGDCWLWTGTLNWKGYGRIGVGRGKTVGVHRVAYMLTYPDREITGVQLDHKCHTEDSACPGDKTCVHRRCCNPAHLEEVDNYTNTLRSQNFMAERMKRATKTHCAAGHELTPDNVYKFKRGGQVCKTCKRKYLAEYWQRPEVIERERERRRERHRRDRSGEAA